MPSCRGGLSVGWLEVPSGGGRSSQGSMGLRTVKDYLPAQRGGWSWPPTGGPSQPMATHPPNLWSRGRNMSSGLGLHGPWVWSISKPQTTPSFLWTRISKSLEKNYLVFVILSFHVVVFLIGFRQANNQALEGWVPPYSLWAVSSRAQISSTQHHSPKRGALMPVEIKWISP